MLFSVVTLYCMLLGLCIMFLNVLPVLHDVVFLFRTAYYVSYTVLSVLHDAFCLGLCITSHIMSSQCCVMLFLSDDNACQPP